jgi:hypothetical protein
MATSADQTGFRRERELASHQASGVPTTSNIKVATAAKAAVMRMALQSAGVIVVQPP